MTTLRTAAPVSFLVRRAPLLLPLVVLAAMVTINPRLREPALWETIARNWTVTALLAIALTPVIITGGMDLSVGSVFGLSAVCAGSLWRDRGWGLGVALAGSAAAGLAAGAVNGAAVLARVSPLVVTLATLTVFRGLAYALSGTRPVNDFPAELSDWWYGSAWGVPHPLGIVLVAFAVVYLLLHHTWMGRMLFAVGDNVRAARCAGVPVRALTFGVYALSGLLAGVAGAASVAQDQAAPAHKGEGAELMAVACVVLGGARVTGGAGHLGGTLLGTATLATLLEGLAAVHSRARPLATGALVVAVAVAGEALARLRASRS